MALEIKDFDQGCCCFLCGRYFEKKETPGEVFCHGERVTCGECWEALSPDERTISKKAIANVIISDI